MDLDAVASELARRFIQRRDVKAIQNPDGTWRPDRTPWTKGDLRRHLRKEVVLGHYLVDPDGICKLFAFDIDLDKGGPRELWQSDLLGPERDRLARNMQTIAFGLAYRLHHVGQGIATVSVAYSGSKGLHVYGFVEPSSAATCKAAAIALLEEHCRYQAVKSDLFWKHEEHPEFTIEVFPKQGEVGNGGLGNLMRLPLGHNHRGDDLPPPYDRPVFLTMADGRWKPDDPLIALREGTTRNYSEPWAGPQ